jgi:hypothetical protein
VRRLDARRSPVDGGASRGSEAGAPWCAVVVNEVLTIRSVPEFGALQ